MTSLAIAAAGPAGLTFTAYLPDRVLCEQTNAHTDRLVFYGEPTPESVGAWREQSLPAGRWGRAASPRARLTRAREPESALAPDVPGLPKAGAGAPAPRQPPAHAAGVGACTAPRPPRAGRDRPPPPSSVPRPHRSRPLDRGSAKAGEELQQAAAAVRSSNHESGAARAGRAAGGPGCAHVSAPRNAGGAHARDA